jgi:hypothetical protein
MQPSSRITDCYKLVNDITFDQCLLEASKLTGLSKSSEEIRKQIEGKSLFDPTIIGKSGGMDITINDLFNEFQKTSHLKIRSTLRDMDFWLMETIIQLPDKVSKSLFFSDVYLQLTYLKVDVEYINKGGVIPKDAPAYNSPICTFPFQRNYYSQLLLKVELQLKKLYQRFGMYLTDELRTYLSTPLKLQAFYDLYDILDYERPMHTEGITGKPLSVFYWTDPKGDLIELITALSLVKRIVTTKGEVSRIQLLNFFTDIFGMERISDRILADRAHKNLIRKRKPAKFLKDLLDAYERVSEEKKKNPQKKPAS